MSQAAVVFWNKRGASELCLSAMMFGRRGCYVAGGKNLVPFIEVIPLQDNGSKYHRRDSGQPFVAMAPGYHTDTSHGGGDRYLCSHPSSMKVDFPLSCLLLRMPNRWWSYCTMSLLISPPSSPGNKLIKLADDFTLKEIAMLG